MKKYILVFSLIMVTLFALSMTQVNAASPAGFEVKKTPGIQQTLNAERRAAMHPSQTKDDPEMPNEKTTRVVIRKGEIVSVVAGSIVINQKNDILQTVTITEDTIIKIPGKKTEGSDTPESLLVGLKVVVRGILEEDLSLTALRISVIPGKPTKSSHIGIVTAITQGASITIFTKKGESFTYSLDANTNYLPKGMTAGLNIGTAVTVIFPRDVTGRSIVASGVVIHPVGIESPNE